MEPVKDIVVAVKEEVERLRAENASLMRELVPLRRAAAGLERANPEIAKQRDSALAEVVDLRGQVEHLKDTLSTQAELLADANDTRAQFAAVLRERDELRAWCDGVRRHARDLFEMVKP